MSQLGRGRPNIPIVARTALAAFVVDTRAETGSVPVGAVTTAQVVRRAVVTATCAVGSTTSGVAQKRAAAAASAPAGSTATATTRKVAAVGSGAASGTAAAAIARKSATTSGAVLVGTTSLAASSSTLTPTRPPAALVVQARDRPDWRAVNPVIVLGGPVEVEPTTTTATVGAAPVGTATGLTAQKVAVVSARCFW